ncbi:hypothetical protein AFK63_00575 [Cronobacter muytjensii ATCC 51329]|nr:hypothetical protein AFK63_00575 [Cronobacter muytjensii ATCC 51329]
MTGAALRAGKRGIVGLVDLLGMLTFRVAATADEHAEAPLPEHQGRIACRTLLPFKYFDNMTIRLPFQRPDVITFRIMRTSQERTMFPGTNKKFSPAFWAGLVFGH